MVFYFSQIIRDYSLDDPVNIGFTVLMALLFGFYLLYTFMGSTSTIAVYEDGIEQRYGSRRLFSTWENLSHFERRKHGRSSMSGIVTNAPMQQRVSGGWIEKLLHYKHDLRFMPLSDVESFRLKYDRQGKIYYLHEKTKQSKFGQILKDYAPHLLVDEDEYWKPKKLSINDDYRDMAELHQRMQDLSIKQNRNE